MHFRAAAEVAPAFHLAHSLLGGVLLRMKRREEAAASFVRAHRLDPGDPETRSRVRRLCPGSLTIDGERAAASIA